MLLLQVVIHIRRELTHTQLYAMDLRKKGKDVRNKMMLITSDVNISHACMYA